MHFFMEQECSRNLEPGIRPKGRWTDSVQGDDLSQLGIMLLVLKNNGSVRITYGSSTAILRKA